MTTPITKFVPTTIADVLVVEPAVFEDDRGFFLEAWNQRTFDDAIGRGVTFVQDNHSRSERGVLRGIHFQVAPHLQGKLVRAVSGAVLDVAVDLRRSSSTFREWVAVELTEDNRRQLWIPPGFGHAFLTLSDTADLLYKASGYYSPESDRSIAWDDPDLAIDWPITDTPILSTKDASAPRLRHAEVFP